MRFAILLEGVVLNIINLEPEAEYDPGEGRTLVAVADRPDVGIGWTLDGETWAPPPPPPAIQTGPRRVSKIDFRRLLTPVEAARYRLLVSAPAVTAAELAAAFNPATDPGEAVDLQIRIAVEDAIQQFGLLPEFIELTHPDTSEFLGVMAAAGMFGEGEASNAATRIPEIIAGQAPS